MLIKTWYTTEKQLHNKDKSSGYNYYTKILFKAWRVQIIFCRLCFSCMLSISPTSWKTNLLDYCVPFFQNKTQFVKYPSITTISNIFCGLGNIRALPPLHRLEINIGHFPLRDLSSFVLLLVFIWPVLMAC